MKHIFLALFLLLALSARAQLDNRLFEDRHPLPDSGRLMWNVTGFSYLRDLEYFNDYSDGKTLFGQQLLGRLGYALRPNIYLTGGMMVQKDFGAAPVRVRPIFTFRYEVNDVLLNCFQKDTSTILVRRRLSFLFGTLEGYVQHRQVEPLQDFESIINRRLEEGFQILYQTPRTFLDVWLDWQNMIYRYSPDQEQIQAGATLEQQVLGNVGSGGPYLKLLGQGRILSTPTMTILGGADDNRWASTAQRRAIGELTRRIGADAALIVDGHLSLSPRVEGTILAGAIDGGNRYMVFEGTAMLLRNDGAILSVESFHAISQDTIGGREGVSPRARTFSGLARFEGNRANVNDLTMQAIRRAADMIAETYQGYANRYGAGGGSRNRSFLDQATDW